jgi:hypothetical protein
MSKIHGIAAVSCGLLLLIGAPASAQGTKPAAPAAPATRVERTVKPKVAQALSATEIRNKLFAVLDRMSPDQKFEFLGRQLSPGELRAELQKPAYSGASVRRVDVGALQRDIDKRDALRVTGANRHAADVVRAFHRKLAAKEAVPGTFAPPPHIDAIEDQQPAYTPGMHIVIRGTAFYTIVTSSGPKSPQVKIRYQGKNASSQTATLAVVDNPGDGPTPGSRLLVAALPSGLGGLMDQTIQLYVETYPAGQVATSNEVPIPFVAKRVVKSVEWQHIQTALCFNILPECDRTARDFKANWQVCNLRLVAGNIPYDGYSNSRLAAVSETAAYAIRVLHEARCMYSDLAPGMDIFEFPLYNGHEIQGTSTIFESDMSMAGPVPQTDPNAKKGALVVWFLADTILYYGTNIALIGPAGVPYNEPW